MTPPASYDRKHSGSWPILPKSVIGFDVSQGDGLQGSNISWLEHFLQSKYTVFEHRMSGEPLSKPHIEKGFETNLGGLQHSWATNAQKGVNIHSCFAAQLFLIVLNQVDNGNVERLCQFFQGIYRRRVFFPLDHANVIAIKACAIGKFLLG